MRENWRERGVERESGRERSGRGREWERGSGKGREREWERESGKEREGDTERERVSGR